MVPVFFTSYVPNTLLKKRHISIWMFTGAIKLLGTPVEKKWAGPCPVQKYELGSYIQFLTAHCPSPWFVSTEELFQFAAKNWWLQYHQPALSQKKRTFSLMNWLLLEKARIYYITMYLSKMKGTSRYVVIYWYIINWQYKNTLMVNDINNKAASTCDSSQVSAEVKLCIILC